LPVEWSSIVLYSMGFAFISIFLGIIIDWKDIRSSIPTSKKISRLPPSQKEVSKAKKKLLNLITYLAVIIGFLFIMDYLLVTSMVFMICLVSLLIPFVWCLVSGKVTVYKMEFKRHIFEGLPKMKN